MVKILLSLATVSMLGTASYADEMNPNYTMGLNVGTEGAGLDISMPVTDVLNIRVSMNGANYSVSETEEDIEYDVEADLVLLGALVDYYPVESNQFRLSGGLFYNGNGITATGKPTNGEYEIDGTTYDAGDIGVLDADLEFDNFAPYLGMGWGYKGKESGWGFSFDIGAMYHGEPVISMNVTRGEDIPSDNGGPNDEFFEQIQADVAAEEQSAQEDASDYQWFPVIRVGVTYTF